jgi:hypothetical protein
VAGKITEKTLEKKEIQHNSEKIAERTLKKSQKCDPVLPQHHHLVDDAPATTSRTTAGNSLRQSK